MELSKRLTAVASLVTAGMKILDIGTDHGYIPIYLIEKKVISEAVALDVNEGPLKRAARNICLHGLEDRISTRLSDGFMAVLPKEADAAVIAGMGGGLMIRILSEGANIVAGLKECILQPQSEIEKVRAFLLEEGFLFIREDMVREDGKYYPMMKVVPPGQHKEAEKKEVWNEEELYYGKLLLETRHTVLRDYLIHECCVKEKIVEQLKDKKTENAVRRCAELKWELERVRKGMNYYAL